MSKSYEYIHRLKWTDVNNEEVIFTSPYDFEKFVFITEEIKKEICPLTNYKDEKKYLIKRLMEFGIFYVEARSHTLWRFFS